MLPTTLTAIFIFSFVVGFGAVISPGPVAVAIVSQAPRRGWTAGPLVATGHVLLELALALLLVFGLGALLARPGWQTAIAVLGGLLLAWMGVTLIADAWRGRARLPRPDETQPRRSAWGLVGLGALATLVNPFWYAWWVTIAAGYLAQAQALSLGAVFAFYFGHISADYAWDTALSTAAAGGRRWMNDRAYQAIFILCGLFFLYLAGVFLRQGLTGLAA